MKQLMILVFVCSGLIACSDESDSISGTYMMRELSQSACNNNGSNFTLDFGNSNCDTVDGLEYCESGSMNFAADGTVTSTIRLSSEILGTLFSINGTGTYVANGNNVTICLPDCSDFTMSGNILRATDMGIGGCDVNFVLERQ
jgi:hypothetical protein